jgi:hypothetical protein
VWNKNIMFQHFAVFFHQFFQLVKASNFSPQVGSPASWVTPVQMGNVIGEMERPAGQHSA